MHDSIDPHRSPFFGQQFTRPRPRGGGRQGIGRGRGAVGRQQVRSDQDMKKVEPDQISDDTQKVAMEVEEKDEVVSAPNDKIMDIVYFNCGDVGHYSIACNRTRCCFICRQESHVVDKCPE